MTTFRFPLALSILLTALLYIPNTALAGSYENAICDELVVERLKKIDGQNVTPAEVASIRNNLTRMGATKYIGEMMNGSTITMPGMIAGAYYFGIPNMLNYLKRGGGSNPTDGNVPISKYMGHVKNVCDNIISCGPQKDGCNCDKEEVVEPCSGKYGSKIWKNNPACDDATIGNKNCEGNLNCASSSNCKYTDTKGLNGKNCKPPQAINVSGQQAAEPKVDHYICKAIREDETS